VQSAHEMQHKLRKDGQVRASTTKALQHEIDRAVAENNKRNKEVDELTAITEKRVCLNEESVKKLEKEIDAISINLHTSQTKLHSKSKLFAPTLEQNLTPISDQKISRIESRSEKIGKKEEKSSGRSVEFEVAQDQKSLNDWLVHKYETEKDEKVKAAISATMSYVFSFARGDTNEIWDGNSSTEVNNRTDTSVTEVKSEVASTDNNECQLAFNEKQLHNICEMNPDLKKFYEADRPLLNKKGNADVRNSVFIASIPNMDDASSIYKTKTRTKSEGNIQKIKPNRPVVSAGENQEIEARGDIGVEERECSPGIRAFE